MSLKAKVKTTAEKIEGNVQALGNLTSDPKPQADAVVQQTAENARSKVNGTDLQNCLSVILVEILNPRVSL